MRKRIAGIGVVVGLALTMLPLIGAATAAEVCPEDGKVESLIDGDLDNIVLDAGVVVCIKGSTVLVTVTADGETSLRDLLGIDKNVSHYTVIEQVTTTTTQPTTTSTEQVTTTTTTPTTREALRPMVGLSGECEVEGFLDIIPAYPVDNDGVIYLLDGEPIASGVHLGPISGTLTAEAEEGYTLVNPDFSFEVNIPAAEECPTETTTPTTPPTATTPPELPFTGPSDWLIPAAWAALGMIVIGSGAAWFFRDRLS